MSIWVKTTQPTGLGPMSVWTSGRVSIEASTGHFLRSPDDPAIFHTWVTENPSDPEVIAMAGRHESLIAALHAAEADLL